MIYRLLSNGAVYAPGIIEWAKTGYVFEHDRETFRKILRDTWHIPDDVAHSLLMGEVLYILDGDTVIIETHDTSPV